MDKKLQFILCLSFIWVNLFAQPSLIKDVNAGGDSSFPFETDAVIAIGDTYYMALDDGSTGFELWKSDGTADGTELVKDIYPGSTTSDLQEFTDFNGVLLFFADDGTNGMELWRSDGTEVGTYMIKDINSSGDGILQAIFAEIHVVNNTAFFEAYLPSTGRELWKTDGTEGGTVIVKDINPGDFPSSPREFAEMNGILYFSASSDDPDVGTELFRSDGTENGTYLVKDINVGPVSSQIKNTTVVENTLFFTANDGSTGEELWKSDGTEGGTSLVKDINPSGGILDFGFELFAYNNSLLFVANDGTNEADLWISDGTENGTQMLKEFSDLGDRPPENFEIFNGLVYFYGFDDIGDGLWKTDGTENGTVLVREFSGNTTAVERNIVNLGNQMVMAVKDSYNNLGFELWVSDGTTNGTIITGDINPGFASSEPANIMNVNGTAIFTANDGTNGRELWKYTPGAVPLSISLSLENEILCNGDETGELLATPSGGEAPYTFSWTPGTVSGNNPTGLTAGNYTVTVTDNQGTTVSESITITEPSMLDVDMSSTGETGGNMDGTATANVSGGTAGYNYEWSTSPTQFTSTANNLSAGDYFVTVTDNNGCTIVGDVVVDLIEAINDLVLGSKLQIYPTITNGLLNINIDNSINKLNWQVIDVNGKLARQGILNSSEQLEFGGLSSGVYFIRFFDGYSFYTQRILKK